MSKFQVLQYTSNPQFPLINQLVNKLIHENYYYFLTVSQCLDLKDYLLARYVYDPLSYSAGIGTPISKHNFIIISHTHIYIYQRVTKQDNQIKNTTFYLEAEKMPIHNTLITKMMM
jgi:hypothetical protein